MCNEMTVGNHVRKNEKSVFRLYVCHINPFINFCVVLKFLFVLITKRKKGMFRYFDFCKSKSFSSN